MIAVKYYTYIEIIHRCKEIGEWRGSIVSEYVFGVVILNVMARCGSVLIELCA